MNAMVETERLFSGVGGRGRIRTIRSLAKNVYLACYLPMALVPVATLMFAWFRYRDSAWSGIHLDGIAVLAFALFAAELLLVPLVVEAVRYIGGTPDALTAHHDVEFLEAVAPPVLMLCPLFLVVPSLFVYGVLGTAGAVAILLFLGGYSIADPQDSDSKGLSWLVVDLAFVGWAAIMAIVVLCS